MPDSSERVLLITGELSFRGSSLLALRLAHGLHQRGYDVLMLCTGVGHIDRNLLVWLRLHELPGYSLPVWGRVVRQTVFSRLVDQPPDVIHVLTPAMLPQALWLGHRLSCPVLLSVSDHAEATRVSIPAGAESCRTIVCVSESVRSALPKTSRLDRLEQRVILPGIPLPDAFDSSEILASGRPPVIGMAGPLEVLKGGSFFLRACHRVIDQGHNLRIVIAGSGPEERNLRRLATSLQLDACVTFVDDSTEMKTFLSAMDIYCLPSLQQGIGVLLLEAMALGRPVIASGVGGILSILEDDRAGLTVPASDSRLLAEAILQLLRDPDQTRQMAYAGREVVARRFSLDRMLDETITLYCELLENRPVSVAIREESTSVTGDRR